MISSTSTKDFTVPAIPQTATEVVSTHFVFAFEKNEGYLRQEFKDGATTLSVRFLKITGTKYSTVENRILALVQTLSDNLEADPTLINGVTISDISRKDFFDLARE